MKKSRKILSIILTLCMVMQMLPILATQAATEFTDEIEYLINDNFSAATDDNDGMDGWTLTDYNAVYTQDITVESVPEYEGSENYVLKYSAPDSDNGDGTLNSYLLRTLDEAVTFEEGKSIVLETRIMQTGGNADGGRSFLKFNMPATYSTLDTWQNYNTLFYIKSGVLYTLNGYSNDGNAVMNDTVVSNNVSGKWLNVKITIDEDLNATYVIKSDDGSVDEEIEEQSLAHPEAAAFYQDVLENLAFRMRIGNTLYIDYVRMFELNSLTMGVNSRYAPNKPVTVTFDKADANFVNAVALYDINGNEIEAVNTIDDTNTIVTIAPTEPLTEGNEYIVKFLASAVIGNYNVEDKKFLVSEIDYLIYDHFETEGDTDGWNHMAVTDEIYAGEVSQTTLEDENGNEVGVLKLTNDIDGKEVLGAQAGQQAGVIKSFDKTTVTEDTKLIIKTKGKYTEPEGRFYFKLNRPDSVNLPKNEWGGSLYSLLTMNKNGVNYVNGTVVANNTEIASTQTMNTGSVANKWIEAEFVVYKENGVDKYDVKINYEGNEKTAKGNFTQPERVYELCGIEGNAFDTFETLAFTTYYGANTIYVDYVEAYTQTPAEMTVAQRYGTSESITVTFDKANAAFKDAVELYDLEGNKIEAVNAIDETNKVVTLTPVNALTEGVYTVKFDTSLIDGNYVVEDKTTMVSDIEYLINDNFGAPTDADKGLNGWELKSYNTLYTSLIKATTELAEGSDNNYLLKYYAPDNHTDGDAPYVDATQSYLQKTFGTSLTFEEGKNIVFETRIKHAGGDNEETMANGSKGRSYFKFNAPTAYTSADTWQNYNTLFYVNNGTLYTLNGYTDDANAVMNDNKVADDVTGKWINVKVTINGTSKKAAYEFVSDDKSINKIVENQSIAHPAHASFVDDVINDLYFRMRNGNTLYIDYVKAYKTSSTEMTVSEKYGTNEPITVTFDKANAEFVNAVELYDLKGNKIEAANTIDDTNKIVTITPANTLATGKYTVKFNSGAIDGNYVVEDKATMVSDTDYLLYDHFEATGNTEGWKHMAVTDEIYAGEVSQTTTEDDEGNTIGILKLTNDIDGKEVLGAQAGQQAGVIKGFDKTTVTEDTKLVIKTKVKYTNTDGRFYIKLNRPDSITLPKNEWGGSLYSIFNMNKNGASYIDGTVDAGSQVIANTVSMNTGSLAGKWVEAEFVVYKEDGVDKYDVKITYADGEKSAKGNFTQPARVYELHEIEGSAFEVFETLAFTTYYGANTIYVDYVEAYAQTPAEMTVAQRYGTSEPITVTFDKANAAFKDAVELYDLKGNKIEAANAIDDTNKIVTITPANALATGKYTVKFNSGSIDGNYIVEDKAIMVSDREYLIYDHFEATGNTEGWKHMAVTDEIYAGEVSQATTEDDKGNTVGVLKLTNEIDGKAVDSGNAGQQAGVIKDFDKTTVTEDTKLVIKTKVKYTKDEGRLNIKLNRPDSTTLPSNESGALLYTLLNMRQSTGASYVDGITKVGEQEVANALSMNTGSLAGKWVETEFVVYKEDGIDKYDVKVTYPDGEKSAKGNFTQAARVYELQRLTGSAFEVFETLAFTTHVSANTIYVDYVEAYIESIDKVTPYITVNNETVTKIKPGDTVVPKFELQPANGAETKFMLISALYTDGKLADTHINTVTTTGETYEDEGFVVPSYAAHSVVKAFVWSGDGKMIPLCEAAVAETATYTVYLSANGDDNAAGAENAPVATLAKAIDLANSGAAAEGLKTAQVLVEDGTYYNDGPVMIDGTNKTVDNLVVAGVAGAEPVFMNAQKLTGNITKVTDTKILERLSHVDNADTVKANLYEYDLATALGGLYNIPSVDLPGSYSYQGNGKTYAGGTYNIPYTQDPTCELTFNGSLMTVARYPNSGYLNLSKSDIVNEGTAPQKWGEFASDAEKLATPFEITNSRAANWENANQALMYGYFMYDWATQTVPVGSISGTNITSEFPAYYGIGNDNARRYYVYNLLEEIDQPYEYFIDRENGKIYFYIPGGVKATDEIAITLNNTFTIDINSPNVTIDGINFNGSRSGAIKSSNRNVIIKNCEISNTAQTAIYILGGRYNVVENCNIHDVNNAINVNAGDAKSLYTGGNIIRNNRISKFARLDKTYAYAVALYGMGHTVEHNKIYDSEHAAIYFQGVENEIKNNDISNVCKETEDAGAIYAGRKWTSRDNKIIGNYIHDIDSPIESDSPVGGIFIDDHFADAHIEGNIFANIGGTAIRGNKGREHNIVNNIFVNCLQSGTWITSVEAPSADGYATQIADAEKYIYKSTEDSDRKKYQEKYFNELFKYDTDGTTVIVNTDELIYGKGLVYKNNLAINCQDDPGYIFGKDCEVEISGNKYDTDATAYFTNAAGKDFTVNLSAIQSVIPGFVNIDFTAMKID